MGFGIWNLGFGIWEFSTARDRQFTSPSPVRRRFDPITWQYFPPLTSWQTEKGKTEQTEVGTRESAECVSVCVCLCVFLPHLSITHLQRAYPSKSTCTIAPAAVTSQSGIWPSIISWSAPSIHSRLDLIDLTALTVFTVLP